MSELQRSAVVSVTLLQLIRICCIELDDPERGSAAILAVTASTCQTRTFLVSTMGILKNRGNIGVIEAIII
jgi:hypothetical protein